MLWSIQMIIQAATQRRSDAAPRNPCFLQIFKFSKITWISSSNSRLYSLEKILSYQFLQGTPFYENNPLRHSFPLSNVGCGMRLFYKFLQCKEQWTFHRALIHPLWGGNKSKSCLLLENPWWHCLCMWRGK